MAKMNSTSLYVTTNQIVLKSNPSEPSTWQDLYRLVPYLRNSLCCVVCGNLLVEPMTPSVGKCPHHLCKKCKGGRKKIKPACSLCKDCEDYSENKQLRVLLQCYKQMCVMLENSPIHKELREQAQRNRYQTNTGVECGAENLIALIKEGAAFQDDYQSGGGLSKSAYSILPCVYTNSSTQTLQVVNNSESSSTIYNSNVKSVPTNRTPLYSVMYAGSGNKITITRKPKEGSTGGKELRNSTQTKKESSEKSIFKKPSSKPVVKQRRGCRCGNATATPGKLTCCGQRCPCYVESKACIECKCRGCRNPHTPDGNKVINFPHILKQFLTTPQQQTTSSQLPQQSTQQVQTNRSFQVTPSQSSQPQPLEIPGTVLQTVKIELDANLTIEQLNEHLNLKVLDPYVEVPTTLPHTFLLDDIKREDDEEITVDI